ncbi:MAG: hypothetical protein A2Y79_05300 [Deltaproteobacteria bacterium RBG_13_43_22]|nr:MAG: hypothetical protein A2Y79_05300 [Deltaproteobacteria bacterium RBG_13_43_22]
MKVNLGIEGPAPALRACKRRSRGIEELNLKFRNLGIKGTQFLNSQFLNSLIKVSSIQYQQFDPITDE